MIINKNDTTINNYLFKVEFYSKELDNFYMVKKGLLDFLKCLKYYFVPLGIISIFTVIGLYVSCTGIVSTVKGFITQAAELAKQVNIDWNGITQSFTGELIKLSSISDLNQLIATIFSSDWIVGTLTKVAMAAFGESLSLEQVTALAMQTIGTLVLYAALFFVFLIVGFAVGIIVTNILVRKELTKVKIGKLILYTAIDLTFWVSLGLLLYLFNSLNRWVGLVLSIVFLLSYVFLCLFEGWLFHGVKKIPLRKVMRIKNVLLLYLIELIIFASVVLTTVLLVLLFQVVIGVYIALPLLVIGFAAINLSAENYVVNLVQKEGKNK